MIAGREPGTLASLPAGTIPFTMLPAGLLLLAGGVVCGIAIVCCGITGDYCILTGWDNRLDNALAGLLLLTGAAICGWANRVGGG